MRRSSIFVFTFYIAILCIPQYVAAQTSASASDVWREEGIASWYGPDFDGRPTASGEIFNSALFTAAHPTLPFGTFLKVTNKHNNRWVTVKVNDRGPFVASRIIDVSKAAAEHLDMINAGTVPVSIETLPGSYASVPKTQAAPSPTSAVPPPTPAVPPPAYTPPAISQAPAPVPEAPPVYEQAPVYAPPPLPPPAPAPVYTPPPAAAPEPIAPVEYNYIPYPPITVYPPFYVQPPQPVQSPYPTVPAFPPSQMPPIFESLPPAQTLPSLPPSPPSETVRPSPLPSPSGSGFKLIPAIIPAPDKRYRLQVGSYKVPRNAVEVFGKLKDAGLNPTYEQNGELYRVVLTGIRGVDVQSATDKLEKAGFREAIIREEN